MVRKAKPSEPPNKRGSPEAVAKRRAARAFNDLLDPRGGKMDGRTEKRKQRLLNELESGTTRAGRELKPIEILSHVHELLELGEDPAALRRLRKARPVDTSENEKLLDVLADLHRAYGFRVEAYAFVGIDEQALRKAKILKRRPPRRKQADSVDTPPSRRRS